MIREHFDATRSLISQPHINHANDAAVSRALQDRQFPEISIESDEHGALCDRSINHVRVSRIAVRPSPHPIDVVPRGSERRDERRRDG